jgi:SAM-dependent methyltransferase
MSINYCHLKSPHSVEGASAALSYVLPCIRPGSILDVGCGMGTWLKAAMEMNIADVRGVDGVALSCEELLFPREHFSIVDLSKPFNLSAQYDLVLCLEVAEHLSAKASSVLISSLVKHGKTILFSAACPNQPGQNHLNCQWPAYWQELFNQREYACDDEVRWRIWNDERIEPWYRQNMFTAFYNPDFARNEPRIMPVIHPHMLPVIRGFSRHLPPTLVQLISLIRSSRATRATRK